MNKVLLSLMMCFSFGSAFAYDEQRAMTNLSHDFAECSAFYFISAQGARNSGAEELAKGLEGQAKVAAVISGEFSNAEVFKARVKLAVEEQLKVINKDYSNMSILMSKYLNFCQSLMTSPKERMAYWFNKK
ncbi:MAG: hypothetical protein ABGX41_11755 [Pseudohongiella sp.]|jgi:hypothetical protein